MRAPLSPSGPLVPDEAALRRLEQRWHAARGHPLVVEAESLRETVYVFRVPTGALWPDTAHQVAAAAREDVPHLVTAIRFRVPTGALWPDTAHQVAAAAREDVPHLVTAIRVLRAEKAGLLDLLRRGQAVVKELADTNGGFRVLSAEDGPLWLAETQAVLAREEAPDA